MARLSSAVLVLLLSDVALYWSGAEAKGEVAYPPMQICPVGYTMHGNDGCLKSITVQPDVSCKHKSSIDASGRFCLSEKHFHPDKKCPYGFETKGKKCIRKESLPVQAQCPEGYVVDESSGHKKVKCVNRGFYEPIPKCPKDSHFDGSVCVQTSKSHSLLECPYDYELGKKNECIRTVMTPPSLKCHKGFTLYGQQCVKSEVTEAKPKCPHGFKLEHGHRCMQHEKIEPERVCAVGISNGKFCERIVEDFPLVHCPKGYEEYGSECVKEHESKVEFKCEHGFKSDGSQCVRTTKYKPDVICPHGTEMGKKGKCEIEDVTRAEFSCKNSVLTGNDQCVEKLYKKASSHCPKGYHSKADGLCEQTQKTKVEYTCPGDSQLTKKHECVYTDEVPAQYVCEHGVLDNSKKCVSTKTGKAPKHTCPKHFNYDPTSNQCAATRHEHPNENCPVHSREVKKGKCEVANESAPLPKCPKHYKNNGYGACEYTDVTKASQFCPSHTHLKHGMCQPLKDNHEKDHEKKKHSHGHHTKKKNDNGPWHNRVHTISK